MKLRSNSPLKTTSGKKCGMFVKSGKYAWKNMSSVTTLDDMESFTFIYQYKPYGEVYGGHSTTDNRQWFGCGSSIDANDGTGVWCYNYSTSIYSFFGTNSANNLENTGVDNGYISRNSQESKSYTMAIVQRGKYNGGSDNVRTDILCTANTDGKTGSEYDTDDITGDNWGELSSKTGTIVMGGYNSANHGSSINITATTSHKVYRAALWCSSSSDSSGYLADGSIAKILGMSSIASTNGESSFVLPWQESGVAQPQHEWLFNNPKASSITDSGSVGGLNLTLVGSPYIGWVGDPFLRS